MQKIRLALLILVAMAALAEPLRVPVGEFSQGRLEGWDSKSFKGRTEYRLVQIDGRNVLRAASEYQASGLYREVNIDLDKTPYLHWSWRIENTLGRFDEATQAGDDYPARVYVIVSGGLAFWKTRSVNYVFSSNAQPGQSWPNAFAGANVMMLAVRSGERETGRWLSEKRNVRNDLQRLFGEEIRHIDAVALMSDTDNTGGRVVAYYGDIFFSAD